MDEFTAYLADRRHTPKTIHLYVRAVAHFGRWLEKQRLDPSTIAESTVHLFLNKHLRHCRCVPPGHRGVKECRAALKLFLDVLRKTGRIPIPVLPEPTPIGAEIAKFEDYLRTTCGFAENTVLYRTRYVKEFLQRKFRERTLKFADLSPHDIIEFISERSRSYKPLSTKVVASSLRSYMRFLRLRGEISRDLSAAVPSVAAWKQAHLPRTLSDEQICRFFSSFDRSTPRGRRDYAICLCLFELGLRASDVAPLCLDDIDWRAGTLRVCNIKTQRSRLLPLPERLGLAIVDYLRNGRPESADRHIFLLHVAPRGMGIGCRVVQNAVHTACARAGFDVPFSPHAFRHTLASSLYEKGATFKEIADILGHKEIDTVSIYTKVSMNGLSKVVLPWPEVRP
jgi:site-specific recombinase XerD